MNILKLTNLRNLYTKMLLATNSHLSIDFLHILTPKMKRLNWKEINSLTSKEI